MLLGRKSEKKDEKNLFRNCSNLQSRTENEHKKKDSIEKKEKENREKSQTKLIEFFVLFSAKENNVT